MNLLTEAKDRALAPTPPFFQKLKRAGLIIAAIGTAVLTAPGAVPSILMAYAGYAITAGTVLVSISQLAVDDGAMESALLG